MTEGTLFELPGGEERRKRGRTSREEARVIRPMRNQLRWAAVDLESLIGEDHPARAIWGFLEELDLSPFYQSIKALESRPGRPTTDPQVLLALWLLATVEGIGSARRLARLCEEHDGYRWLRGHVPINYHMLSDFRVAHQEALDDLLTQIVAALMAAGAVRLKRVAQDGMRVRASAGASSYRGKGGLERGLAQARQQVERLAQQRDGAESGVTRRQQAARDRAAREREQRVGEALRYLSQMEVTKQSQRRKLSKSKRSKVSEARVSSTDPEAKVMKMADGGFRPAYNVEVATDSAAGVIVGVSVTSAGTDAGQAAPMEAQVANRTGVHPESYLIDGGFANREDITALEQRDVRVYAPVRLPRNRPEQQRYHPRYGDGPEVARWRRRMATDEAKSIYRQRAAMAEWTNAQLRVHGVSQFNVRGLAKVNTVVLLAAVAHNLLRWSSLIG